MEDLRDYLAEIINSLKKIDPYRIILFGSLSKTNAEMGNDIDIAVIVDSDILPATFEEKMALRIKVRNAIFDLSEKIPIDLIVYTRSEYSKLVMLQQPFIKEINSGQILYDKAG